MFANLKKKIESEVGDLSRLAPSNVLNRTNSSTLSSRHPSVSSLTSEPPNVSLLATPLSPNPVEFGGGGGSSSSATPNRSSGGNSGVGHSSLLSIKVKQLEEKLQAQESDFAWRLSTKDDDITNLNKTIEILTSQLKSQDSEVKKKLVRVQEDIDDLEGFSQQENAKLKHLLLNKEEELGALRNSVFVKGTEVEELRGKVKSLEVENERVKVALEKLSSSSGGSSTVDAQVEAEVNKNRADLERGLEEEKRKNAELESALEKLEKESKERLCSLTCRVEKTNQENEVLRNELDKLKRSYSEVEETHSRAIADVISEWSSRVESVQHASAVEVSELRSELEREREQRKSELEREREQFVQKQKSELEAILAKREEQAAMEVQVLKDKCAEVENEKEKLIVNVSVAQARVQELEGEVSNLESLRSKVEELQGSVAEKENLEKTNQENVVLRRDLESLKRSYSELEKTHSRAIADVISEWTTTVESLKSTSAVELSAVKRELEKEREQFVQKQKSEMEAILAKREEQAAREVQVLKDKCTEVENEKEKLIGNVSEMKARVHELEREVSSLESLRSKIEELQGSEKENLEKTNQENVVLRHELESLKRSYSELENTHSRAIADVISEWTSTVESLKSTTAAEVSALKSELERQHEQQKSELERREAMLAEREELAAREVQVLKDKCAEVENEKDELIVNVSEVQARVDELEEEVSSLESLRSKIEELEGCVAEKEKQLRQQSHALSDLRRSLAKELKASSSSNNPTDKQHQRTEEQLLTNNAVAAAVGGPPPSPSPNNPVEISSLSSSTSNHMNGSVVAMRSTTSQHHSNNHLHHHHDAVSLSSGGGGGSDMSGCSSSNSGLGGGGGAATLPQYETDVNFMYLRSVLFKYLTSQDPQITSHLTRVVATLLHLTEEETNTLIQSMESKTNQHILSHIIK